MSHIQYIDELIREYLLYRGFSGTLKVFDYELKSDKDKSFRVDKIVEQLMQYVSTYDLNSLKELWHHLDQNMFSKLEQHFTPAVRKLEHAVLKMYLVNAVANGKPERVTEFFMRYGAELQGQSEWKEWFVLPFVKTPEDNPSFAVHFTRQWQDTMLVSLHNFLATVFQCMPQPTLARYEDEGLQLKRLQEENEMLRQRLRDSRWEGTVPDAPDLMDDFYVIALETATGGESQTKKFKSIIRNIGSGLPTSPILGRKQHQQQQAPPKVKMTTSQSVEEQQHKKQVTKQRLGSVPWATSKPPPGPAEGPSTGELGARQVSSGGAFLLLSQEEHSDHRSAVSHCKFNPSGSTVLSADVDGLLKLWSIMPTSKTLATFVCKASVLALDWVCKNERYFIAGSRAGIVRLYDTSEKKTVWELGSEPGSPLLDSRIIAVCCNPSESTFVCSAAGEKDGKLLLYDIKTRKLERSLSLEPSTVVANCCALNHNGQLLLAGCSDGTVRIYDMRRADCIDQWAAHQGSVLSLQLTSDYTQCCSVGQDGKLCQRSLSRSGQGVWEATLPEGEHLYSMSFPHGQLFTFDPSGSYMLVAGATGGSILKVGPSGVMCVLDLGGHRSPVTAVDWSFANQCATSVTASTDGKVKVSTLLTP